MYLRGKWVWIWLLSACDGGDLDKIAGRVKGAGCRGVFVKAGDGGHGFGQSLPVTDILAGLQARGIEALPWFYWYLADVPGVLYGVQHFTWSEEADQLVEVCRATGARAAIIDVEAESEKSVSPTANARLALARVKAALPQFEPYYAPLAQPTYHPRLPYAAFNEFCEAVLPQAYHNAMEVSPRRAVDLCFDSFQSAGVTSRPLLPAGGAYGSVTGDELVEWAAACIERGSTALSWWSYQHMSNELWDAVSRVEIPEVSDVDEEARKQIAIINLAERWASMIRLGQLQTVLNEAKALGVSAE